ncbi:hypothetical protein ACHWQZ_G012170 [Mnemiopsis leidyi]
MPIDYSKWKDIEISDDEDDTHPNIDTPSLFRWRHQARVDRMGEFEKNKAETKESLERSQRELTELKNKLKASDEEAEKKKIEADIEKLEKQFSEWKNKEAELEKQEKLAPWNVDTICRDGFSKTTVNKMPEKKKVMSEDEKLEQSQKFMDKHKKEIEKFGFYSNWDDSKEYLLSNPHLACEDTANYLTYWCVNLQMEEKNGLMKQVAHQTIVMQYILELSKTMEVPPIACVPSFFTKIKTCDAKYMDGFNQELDAFIGRIERRAKEKTDKLMAEIEAEEREKRLGPGGLDPQEVYEELPPELQNCFDSKDIGMLQEVLTAMKPDEAQVWLKKCIDSGLWVPGPSDDGDDAPPPEQSLSGGVETTKKEIGTDDDKPEGEQNISSSSSYSYCAVS